MFPYRWNYQYFTPNSKYVNLIELPIFEAKMMKFVLFWGKNASNLPRNSNYLRISIDVAHLIRSSVLVENNRLLYSLWMTLTKLLARIMFCSEFSLRLPMNLHKDFYWDFLNAFSFRLTPVFQWAIKERHHQ